MDEKQPLVLNNNVFDSQDKNTKSFELSGNFGSFKSPMSETVPKAKLLTDALRSQWYLVRSLLQN